MEIIGLAATASGETPYRAPVLVPRQVSENGLEAEQFEITDEALMLITARYTREAGVRQFERTIGSITRKAALKIV